VRMRFVPPRDLKSFDLMMIASLGVAGFAGWAIGHDNLFLALVPTVLIVGIVLFERLSLAGWCGLLLLLTVVSRGVVATLGLPDVFNFVHYPAALAFAMAAAQRPKRQPTRLPAGRWIKGLLLLTAVSSIVNSTNPIRILMFLLIVGEPITVIWAIQRWGMDEATEERVGRLAFVVLLTQIPLGLWQGSVGGWNDSVQGTMVGHGAGAHVLGGLFALGLFTWLAGVVQGRHSWLTGGVAAFVAFGMMSAAGALQVIFLAAAALPAIVLVRQGRQSVDAGEGDRRRRSASRTAIASVLILLVLGPIWSDLSTSGLSSRAADLADPSQREEFVLAKERALSEPLHFLLGSGPGTSASRAALLLTPRYNQRSGSFLLELPIEATALAEKYSLATKSISAGGSAESAASSMLGVLGDLGILGFLGLTLMFFGAYRASKRLSSWLAPAVASALIMTFALAFVDNWLEYPEFSVPLAILIGFGTTTHYDGMKSFRTLRHDFREVALIAHPRGP
jgi:hypothetical protein